MTTNQHIIPIENWQGTKYSYQENITYTNYPATKNFHYILNIVEGSPISYAEFDCSYQQLEPPDQVQEKICAEVLDYHFFNENGCVMRLQKLVHGAIYIFLNKSIEKFHFICFVDLEKIQKVNASLAFYYPLPW